MTPLTTEKLMMPPDAVDAALAAGGDAEAFERLYRRHVAKIHGLTRRMLDADVEETIQDVFVRAWQKLGTFRGESQFSTWLHRLAVNVILAKRSTLKTERQRFHDGETDVLELIPTRSAAPDTKMDFEAAIVRLPPGARDVFVLHDVEGYKHEEISELLGISAGTSKSQLHRARMMLRAHL